MDPEKQPFDTAILRKAGLTESQAKGYLTLIEHGELSPTHLGTYTGESRTNAYMICDKLVALGLATKSDSTKTLYRPTNPQNLKKLLVQQQQQLRSTNNELSALLPNLVSQFNLISDEAGVTTLEGVEGLKTFYSDILREGHNLAIIPSAHDRTDESISGEIDKQIAKQIESGIESRVLYSEIDKNEALDLRNHGIHVRQCPLDTPAQIIIYGENVAISTFRLGMITTIVHHPDIAQSLQAIFELLWSAANDPLDTAPMQLT